jgi:hypothetical protein
VRALDLGALEDLLAHALPDGVVQVAVVGVGRPAAGVRACVHVLCVCARVVRRACAQRSRDGLLGASATRTPGSQRCNVDYPLRRRTHTHTNAHAHTLARRPRGTLPARAGGAGGRPRPRGAGGSSQTARCSRGRWPG